MDFTINNHDYKSRKLDVMKQFHLARRLAPALTGLAIASAKARDKAIENGTPADEAGASKFRIEDVAGPMLEAIADMSEADTEWVINTCLQVVERQQGNGWAKVRANNTIMFDDIELPEMLQIVGKVVQDALGSFFPSAATPELTTGTVAAAP